MVTYVLHGCNMWTSAVMEVMVVGSGLEAGNQFLLKCKQRLFCFMLNIVFRLFLLEHVPMLVSSGA